MEVNYGSTRNLIEAIYETGKQDTYKFVYIGTVAETGDWKTKLRFRCAFGHEFEASPRLVLEA